MGIKYLNFFYILFLISCNQLEKTKSQYNNSESVKFSKWFHYNTDSSDIYEIELVINEKGSITGKHIFTFNNGEKIDAFLSNQASIKGQLKNVEAKVFWFSSFCSDSSLVKIVFETDSTLLFKPLSGCTGELGKELIFKKIRPTN